MELMDKLEAVVSELKAKVAEMEKPADQPAVDLQGLQEQIKKLGDERDAKAKEAADLRAAIQAEVDDAKSDTARLEKAIEPIEEVKVEAPVPQVEQPAPAAQASEPAPAAPAADQKPVEGNDQLADITKG